MAPHGIEAAPEMLMHVAGGDFQVRRAIEILHNHGRARAHLVDRVDEGCRYRGRVGQQLPFAAFADVREIQRLTSVGLPAVW